MFKTQTLTLTLKVSEEETFEDNKALWWSPDSSRLVYGVFDDTNVDVLQLPRSSNLMSMMSILRLRSPQVRKLEHGQDGQIRLPIPSKLPA